jgi:NADH:ubiquinone oxidoreductase subunit 6 (subunit J)
MKFKPTKKTMHAILAAFLSLLIFLTFVATSQAAIENPVTGALGDYSEDAENGKNFVTYFVYLWQVCITLGALAVIVFFILGAFGWITAGSDSKKVESARNRMTNAVVGLVILVSLVTIFGFMSKLLFGNNFDILRLTIPMLND